MPDFVYDHKVYYNPVEFALLFIGGTWKMPILWRLNQATMRYGELKKRCPTSPTRCCRRNYANLNSTDWSPEKSLPRYP